jgi:hypothetical protein
MMCGAGENTVWEINSYRDSLSENAGPHHAIGSALIMLLAAVLLLIVFA